MCELVMTGEDLSKHLNYLEVYADSSESDEEDDIERESFDIPHDMEFGLHRQRSNTAVRLEKLDQAQKKAAKVITVNRGQSSELCCFLECEMGRITKHKRGRR